MVDNVEVTKDSPEEVARLTAVIEEEATEAREASKVSLRKRKTRICKSS
jgi:hypothetical protein